MRVARGEGDVVSAIAAAQREAMGAFGSDILLAERYLTHARHVEVQVLADGRGEVVVVGDRECSVQRRHQKLVEEAPAPNLSLDLRRGLAGDAATLMRSVGYRGAGTVEFLVAGDEYYFLEVNTRIQVEHTVTEEVTGVDLVVEQLRIAGGEPLRSTVTPEPRGHAFELRINAEDPFSGFAPHSGRITRLQIPRTAAVRLDTGYREGDAIPSIFDSLIAKLVVRGVDRESALRSLIQVADGACVEGLPTTIPVLADVLAHPDFQAAAVWTSWFEDVLEPEIARDDPRAFIGPRDVLEVAGQRIRIPAPEQGELRPKRAVETGTIRGTGSVGRVTTPMIGTVLAVHVAEGQRVEAGDGLVIIEAMKMENVVRAEAGGTVAAIHVRPGDVVRPGQGLLDLS